MCLSILAVNLLFLMSDELYPHPRLLTRINDFLPTTHDHESNSPQGVACTGFFHLSKGPCIFHRDPRVFTKRALLLILCLLLVTDMTERGQHQLQGHAPVQDQELLVPGVCFSGVQQIISLYWIYEKYIYIVRNYFVC